jgi:glutathione S-transferase
MPVNRKDAVITLYTWTTPNGRKPAVMLGKRGLPYRQAGQSREAGTVRPRVSFDFSE